MIYNIFISHSWAYEDHYSNLKNLLNSDPFFNYKDYSVPKDDPIHNADNDRQLKLAIQEKMRPTSCVLILAGVYATYSKWINKEIELAQEGFTSPKKIIAIELWGSERTSSVVKDAADAIVKWQSSSIIDAIKA